MQAIYLDYAASTPIDPDVAEKMYQALTDTFGNPASDTHLFGYKAKQLVEQARKQVASAINAEPNEIVWTSGATEADNLALKGVAEFHGHKGKHIITVKTEHKAILDTCKVLEKQGFSVTYLPVEKNGLISLLELQAAITSETILISVMLVNNETGVIQDVGAIAEIAHKNNIFLHVDGAQAIGKIKLDVKAMDIDLLSLSAHKAYGPKGVGALYVRRKPRVKIAAQMHGGGHEFGMRSGTLATHQSVGMGVAFAIATDRLSQNMRHAKQLQQLFLSGLTLIDDIKINSDPTHSVANIINVSFGGVNGDALLTALMPLAVSTGSACNSVSIEPSHVLQAMQVPLHLAASSIRFSFGRFTTEAQIKTALEIIQQGVMQLRKLAP